ncbi:hypothetical protein ACOQFV_21560 [Nocardiopsis changdeensis]|uniref:Uncharacterized protein n=1 Tax=Nocardiopsis changdeensis TaxID=2831969 RepID=A0ABX8BFE7_9ACTN|nr:MULTISPECIES: hypothetical protein [Nocardiopsis]QUX20970.1 hypothetical protein KGD84_21245 [Nocardiopsis changdeensis]QYX36901.1 hypothetical protein K1J57_30700 [Nocardiopsis sp. MT53]
MAPEEDSGSRTLNRYRWQSRVATRDLLALLSLDLTDRQHGEVSPHRALISERHEDWALFDGDRWWLVSAKHLDNDQGAWTWSTLMSDGGIPHLYRNYRRLSEAPGCRMVTNNAIRSMPETRLLRDLCQLEDGADATPRNALSPEERAGLNLTLARYLLVHHKDAGLSEEESQGRSNHVNHCEPNNDLIASSTRFLDSLLLDTNIPGRRHIVDAGPLRFVRPVLHRLGHPSTEAEAVWEALTGFVEQSMEDQLPTEDAGLTDLIRSFSTRPHALGPEAVEKRTVTTGQALTVIERALRRPQVFLAPGLPFEHKVSVKMTVGKLESNAIQRAEDRMATWRKTCAAEVDDSPGNHAQLQEFADELEDRVDDLHVELRNEGVGQEMFGTRLWHSATRLPPESFPPLPFRLTRTLLTGALADASDQCRIWFTPFRFNADAILLGSSTPVSDAQDEEGSE